MFNITTTPVTTIKVVVELDEPAAREILVDASRFQAQLRARLAESHNGNGKHPVKVRRHPKAAALRREKTRKRVERVPCENCGVLIASYRQGKHKCRTASASGAASSV